MTCACSFTVDNALFKRLFAGALLCGLFLPAALHAKGTKPWPMTLSLVPEKNVVMVGEPFYVTETVKNDSALDLPMWGAKGGEGADFVLIVAGPDGHELFRSGGFSAPAKVEPAPLPAHGKTSGDVLLPGETASGKYVITLHVEFSDQSRPPVKTTATITVVPPDSQKMGALIDGLGSNMLLLASTNSPQGSALEKLMAIHDERVVPWLVRVKLNGDYMKFLVENALAKFPADVVEKARKDAAANPGEIPASSSIEPVAPADGDDALEKAIGSGDARQVAQLVRQGADIKPFANADGLIAKFWAAPLGRTAVSSELTIDVPKHVTRDAEIPIHIEFKNTTGSTRFFNPELRREYEMPVGILLFDGLGNCIGDLFDSMRMSGSHNIGANPGMIDQNEVRKIDTTFTIPSKIYANGGMLPLIHFASDAAREEVMSAHGIPPGHYTVQMVMWLRAIAPLPDDIVVALNQKAMTAADRGYERYMYFQNPLWLMPLYRSNPVAIDVDIPGEAPAPSKPAPVEKGVTVTVVPEKEVIMLGEPIYASITIKNNSDKNYSMLYAFDLSAKGADGSEVKNRNGGRGIFFMSDNPGLQIGDERTERLSLFENAVFTQRGDYVITGAVSAGNGTNNGGILVKGTAKIKVVPADDAKMAALIDGLTQMVTPLEAYSYAQEEAKDKLVYIGGDRVRAWCMKALASDSGGAQAAAISVLERLGDQSTFGILKKAMDNTLKYPDYRSAHASGDNYLVPEARPAFIDYLRGCISNHTEDATRYLLGLAKHPDPRVRYEVMTAVPYQIPAAKALPTVRMLAKDKDDNVRERAKFLLIDLKRDGGE